MKKRFRIYSPTHQRLKKLLGLWLLFGTTLSLLVGLLAFGPLPSSVAYKVGQVSPRAIRAERTVEVVNQPATEAARRHAADSVPKVFVFDSSASRLAEEKLASSFRILQEVARLRRQSKVAAEEIRNLLYQLPISLSPSALEALTGANPERLKDLEDKSHDLLWKALENGIRTDQVGDARSAIRQEAEAQHPSMPLNLRQAIVEVASACVLPNRNFDREATAGAVEAAMAEVKPVTTVVPEGAIVVREGEIINEDHMRVINALGLNQARFNFPKLAGHGLLVASLMLIIMAYLSQVRRYVFQRSRNLALICVIAVFRYPCILIARLRSIFAGLRLTRCFPLPRLFMAQAPSPSC